MIEQQLQLLNDLLLSASSNSRQEAGRASANPLSLSDLNLPLNLSLPINFKGAIESVLDLEALANQTRCDRTNKDPQPNLNNLNVNGATLQLRLGQAILQE